MCKQELEVERWNVSWMLDVGCWMLDGCDGKGFENNDDDGPNGDDGGSNGA